MKKKWKIGVKRIARAGQASLVVGLMMLIAFLLDLYVFSSDWTTFLLCCVGLFAGLGSGIALTLEHLEDHLTLNDLE